VVLFCVVGEGEDGGGEKSRRSHDSLGRYIDITALVVRTILLT
jgi:hypothetical protein